MSAGDVAPGADNMSAAPLLRVVAGSPSADELAVVVAVLTSRLASAPVEPAWSLWNRKSRMVRPSLRAGFGAWRASTMPR